MVINPDYTFETYVVGPNNRLAHAAAVAVSQQPGIGYNPFFLHGRVGLGKTHLLQAICQAILSSRPQFRIYYNSCDGFASQFIEAEKAGQKGEFRHKFRDIDLLVIDDIHLLSAYARVQDELFATVDSLWLAHKQIVFSSDMAPDEIPKLEDRLLSRFRRLALVARVDKPDYDTRLAILRIKARLRGLELPDDVLSHVAQNVDSNVCELEGGLTQLQATALATNRAIDLELAREVFSDRGADLDGPAGRECSEPAGGPCSTEPLEIRLHVPANATDDEIRRIAHEFILAANALHIARGGSGLEIDSVMVGIRGGVPQEVPT